MSRIPDDLKNNKINTLHLPGSHDSSSYELDLSIQIQDGIFEDIRKYGRYIAKPIISKWTITQNMNIYDQLINGIRYLDIRISELNNDFYTSHTYVCTKLIDILDQIYLFSKDNITELIIIDMTLDFRNKSSYKHNDILTDIIKNHDLYSLCYKIINNEIPIYNEIIDKKKPIVFLIDNELNLDIDKLNYDKRFKKWTNSQTNCDNIIRSLLNIISICNNNNYITIFEETLTPTDKDIILGSIIDIISLTTYLTTVIIISIMLINNYETKYIIITFVILILFIIAIHYMFRNIHLSLYDMSENVHGTLIKVLNSDNSLKKYINVISGDFITHNFCKSVIDLNYK